MREQRHQRGKGEVNSIKYDISISLSFFFFFFTAEINIQGKVERLYIHMLDYENFNIEK